MDRPASSYQSHSIITMHFKTKGNVVFSEVLKLTEQTEGAVLHGNMRHSPCYSRRCKGGENALLFDKLLKMRLSQEFQS